MTVCMFPGQGSQAKGMGKDLFARFPELTASASDILGYPIDELCTADRRGQLGNTRFTQPALYVVNALSYRRHLEDGGARPDWLLGHSLGEYNALEAAGVFGFDTGLRLVQRRGALMAEAPPGAMAAVIGMAESDIRARLEGNGLASLDIANLNAPTQIIISGLKDDVARAAGLFETGGVRFFPLNTSGAFHSRYMAPARREYEAFLEGFTFASPAVPVISNVYAEPYAAGRVAATLAEQITSPVRWAQSVGALLARGETDFRELGPGQVLTKLAADIRRQMPAQPAPVPIVATAARNRAEEVGLVQQHIDEWNRSRPPGTRVTVTGQPGVHATRSQAMLLFGHRAAIYLEGFNGYFGLSDVRPAT